MAAVSSETRTLIVETCEQAAAKRVLAEALTDIRAQGTPLTAEELQ